ncbi:hypothetical protein EJ06DRAFT_543120 [Trichodelitschia bisporula]|uniref:Uncharacterized protein n=1 Tax=Trichodelitschia bisporula TaxID=703511 RepID=A0A6G1HW28_9PEZI|nr:hypothetical protein EJ06DRAFT_543120 [Trichodelitschia bisporula]
MTTSLAMAPPQRPRLSLNTAQTRTFGKGTSLRLETLSAVSPTARNTFQNAFEQASLNSCPAKLERPRLSIDSSVSSLELQSPSTPESLDSRTPSSSSVSSASTVSAPTVPAYKPNHNLKSILRNSPLPRTDFRRTASRPLFPAQKRVAFRDPIKVEIVNTQFIYAHSDIDETEPYDEGVNSKPPPPPVADTDMASPPTEDLSPSTPGETSLTISDAKLSLFTSAPLSLTMPLPSPSSPFAPSPKASKFSPPRTHRRSTYRFSRTRIKPHSPRAGDKRDSSSESDSDSCPETPVAGRRKRRREWVWTLGPQDTNRASPEDAQSVASTENRSTPSTIAWSTCSSVVASDDSS